MQNLSYQSLTYMHKCKCSCMHACVCMTACYARLLYACVHAWRKEGLKEHILSQIVSTFIICMRACMEEGRTKGAHLITDCQEVV